MTETRPADDAPIGVVTTVMHDTADLEGAVAFWTGVLGLTVEHREGPYVYLSPMGGDAGPRLAFQQVAEPRDAKNRLHLDVRVPDRLAFEQRVLDLGGSKVREHQEGNFPAWSVMADPEGNQFCIYDRGNG